MAAEHALVMDIGATNARFALFDLRSALDPVRVVVVPTVEVTDEASLARQAHDLLQVDRFASACVAMAGPVTAGSGRITNGQLALTAGQLQSELNAPTMLVNDFFALAHGVGQFEKLLQIGGEAPPPDAATAAVIGAGSGLGMSVLVRGSQGEAWKVLPSEGGHADLACAGELEIAVLQVLLQRHNHVCWETVLSGPGLVNLYEALAEVWGYPPDDEPLTPEWISEQGVDAQVPLCHQTLELFFAFLGAAAGNLALTTYATGGVYVAGGIVPQLELFARASPMRRRFEARGRMQEAVSRIPLYLVADQHPGLRGAACLLRATLN